MFDVSKAFSSFSVDDIQKARLRRVINRRLLHWRDPS